MYLHISLKNCIFAANLKKNRMKRTVFYILVLALYACAVQRATTSEWKNKVGLCRYGRTIQNNEYWMASRYCYGGNSANAYWCMLYLHSPAGDTVCSTFLFYGNGVFYRRTKQKERLEEIYYPCVAFIIGCYIALWRFWVRRMLV